MLTYWVDLLDSCACILDLLAFSGIIYVDLLSACLYLRSVASVFHFRANSNPLSANLLRCHTYFLPKQHFQFQTKIIWNVSPSGVPCFLYALLIFEQAYLLEDCTILNGFQAKVLFLHAHSLLTEFNAFLIGLVDASLA